MAKAVAMKKPAPVAKQPSKEVATRAKAGELVVLTEEDAVSGPARGFENVTVNDMMIPRLTILQALSPQVLKNKPEYIKGAEMGDFCDVSTGDIFKERVEIIPVFFTLGYLEWAPRNSGKGLIKNWGSDSTKFDSLHPDEKGKRWTDEDESSYVQDTAQWYALNVSADFRPSFIPLASTNMKSSRRWNTQLGNQRHEKEDSTIIRPSMWYRSWYATPAEQSNNDGTWFIWKFEPGRKVFEIDPSGALWNNCRTFYEQVSTGKVRGDVSTIQGELAEDTGEAGVM